MNKGFTRKRSRYHSHKIDKFLIQEYEHRKKEIQLLLIGLSNSGKNTFCKQMRLHFGDGFPVAYRNEMKSIILANITDAIAMVLEYMKEENITFSDILAHKLQEYLVNSRSENGWITKDFIIFDEQYKTTNDSNNTPEQIVKHSKSTLNIKLHNKTDQLLVHHSLNDNHCITTHCNLPCIASLTKLTIPSTEFIQSNSQYYVTNPKLHQSINSSISNTESITDSIVEKFLYYVHENNSIPPSVLKKFESIIDVKSIDNWQNIIKDKNVLHHLINILLQSGIDNWSAFLMHQSTPPPIPTTLPPISVEDELLDYIVTSDGCDSSEETDEDDDNDDDDDDDDDDVDDNESGLVNTSNSLVRTLVGNTSISEGLINYNHDDANADDDDNKEIKYNEDEDWDNYMNYLPNVRTEDVTDNKPNRKISVSARRKHKDGDHSKSESIQPNIKSNYVELSSNFNLLEFSIDQLSERNYTEHKISLRSLQIIMKIITDQIEFRKVFIEYLPILTQRSYAGSYFIKCLDRIIQDDYVPTLQDLLIMKQTSKAVKESLLSIGSITLRTINLGEYSEHKQLNKQFHYFESVNMILFFISLEDVYRYSRTVEGNKMFDHQTFKLFEEIVNSPDLTRKDIVVYLNKYDVLKSIITPTINDVNNMATNKTVHEKTIDVIDWNKFIEKIKSYLMVLRNNANIKGPRLLFHVICALDIDKMKWIMKDTLRTIIELNRKRHLIF
ncbi:Guanine nucleotide-binding protein alpha-4 subunit [Schistosoma japonicum]|uniref:Guanine nucleotide-binding protein alpha-4 subunit n=1 Tax=Schistosoma japonicum TaxID=6182 RepID=A0A4Z2CUX7_SCHJA|nr:Guanine nucleotide-binding protein alpha-4 subunit [Schistosoma japonicum]